MVGSVVSVTADATGIELPFAVLTLHIEPKVRNILISGETLIKIHRLSFLLFVITSGKAKDFLVKLSR